MVLSPALIAVAALLFAAVFMAGMMALAWRLSLDVDQSGWIDAIWVAATGGAGAALALAPVGPVGARNYLVALLLVVWAGRLAGHIAKRTVAGADDPRYAELKRQWGDQARPKLFTFLQYQAAAGFLLAVAAMAAAHSGGAFRFGDILGLAIGLVAIFGETVADRQLREFRDATRDGVCDHGLWALSRHPNYFFEWFFWLSLPLIGLDLDAPLGWGLVSLAAPVTMYVLLIRVSGIPPLETHMLRSRGDAYRAYQARVPAFWLRLF